MQETSQAGVCEGEAGGGGSGGSRGVTLLKGRGGGKGQWCG
jgi:hypothetical protein